MEKFVVAIHQPPFLPWIGYFYKIYKADILIHFDTDKISKGGMGNRNKIKLGDKESFITVPIAWKDSPSMVHKDLIIDYKQNWIKKHLHTLQTYYSKSKYFEEIFYIIKSAYKKEFLYLDELNIYLVNKIVEYLNFDCFFYRASSLNVEILGMNSTEKLIRLIKAVNGTKYLSGFGGLNYMNLKRFTEENIKVKVYDYNPLVYNQLGKNFIKNLSIIDLLFNEGPNSKNIIKRSFSNYEI